MSAHRGEYKKRGGFGGRKAVTQGLRNERKEAAVAAKRLKRGEFEELDGAIEINPVDLYRCVELLKAHHGDGSVSEEQRQALDQLRQWLCHTEADVDAIVEAGAVEPLLNLVQHNDRDTFLHAAWCITNIASSTRSDHAQALLPSLPALTARCDPSDVEVAEQCAWAIGNLAAGHIEMRDAVVAAGGLVVLVGILREYLGVTPLSFATCSFTSLEVVPSLENSGEVRDGFRSLSECAPTRARTDEGRLVSTVLWALIHMARGDRFGRDVATHHGLFFSNDIAAILTQLLLHPEQCVAIEAAWLMAYLCKPGLDAVRQFFVRSTADAMTSDSPRLSFDGPQAVSPSLAAFVLIGMLHDAEAPNVSLPALRVLSNVTYAMEDVTLELAKDYRFLPYLGRLLRRTLFLSVETACVVVLSNIAAVAPSLLVDNGIMDILLRKLQTCHFVLQKEICFALLNVAGEPKYLSRVLEAGVLGVYISMLRTVDVEAQRMGLSFIELVLQKHPHGCQMVERMKGIDAMDKLQMSENPSLYARVDTIMERYFSEIPNDDLDTRQEVRDYPSWRPG